MLDVAFWYRCLTFVVCRTQDWAAQKWQNCHSLSLASVKSRLVLLFWYRLTWVVPDKGPLNGCVYQRLTAIIIATVIHCFLPDDFGNGSIIPLLKDKTGNFNSLDNYLAVTVIEMVWGVDSLALGTMYRQRLLLSWTTSGFSHAPPSTVPSSCWHQYGLSASLPTGWMLMSDVVEKTSTCRFVVIDEKCKSLGTFNKNSSDLPTDYSNDAHFWRHISDKNWSISIRQQAYLLFCRNHISMFLFYVLYA